VTTGEGMAAFLEALQTEVETRAWLGEEPAPTRVRHRLALEACLEALGRADAAGEVALQAEDLRTAVHALGRITGRVGVEDLLDVIFRDFCIGK
jgi:tRNA modification GTPase